jgi:hypothetical protein
MLSLCSGSTRAASRGPSEASADARQWPSESAASS